MADDLVVRDDFKADMEAHKDDDSWMGTFARAYLERDAQLAEARVRRYGQRRAAGSDHTTACSIWGDDGQGNAEGFSGPLICNCGALENFYQAQLAAMTAERDYHIVQAEGLFDKLTAAETALSAKTAEWAEGLSAKAIWRNAFKEWQMRAESLDGKLTASEAARGKAVDALVKIARPGDFTLPAEIARDCLETLAEPGKAGES